MSKKEKTIEEKKLEVLNEIRINLIIIRFILMVSFGLFIGYNLAKSGISIF